MTTAELRRARRRGVGALSEREVLRVVRLWNQTIAPPVVAAVLFIVVFGVALGDRIRVIDGVSYEEFIVPGLMLMGVATSAFGNNATSIFQARNDGFIEDPASSPMTPSQLLAGYLAGGLVRSLLIGFLTLASSNLGDLEGRFVGLALLGALFGGVLSVIVGEARIRTAGVRVDLDASRRWVTLSQVHPSFVAACQAHEQRQPQRT